MASKKAEQIVNIDDKATGSSVLLRLGNNMGNELRRIAKLEERSITTVVVRALRSYFKSEHNIEVVNDD